MILARGSEASAQGLATARKREGMGNESKVQQRESESMMGMPVKKSVEWFMGGRGLEGGKCVYKPLVNIYHNNLIWLLMDPGSCDESIIDRLMNQPGEQENRRSS